MHRWLPTLLLIVTASGFLGCGSRDQNPASSTPSTTGDQNATPAPNGGNPIARDDRPPAGHPSDFFPTATGSTWTYEIELVGDQHPLKYEQVAWPQGQGSIVYRSPLALKRVVDSKRTTGSRSAR